MKNVIMIITTMIIGALTLGIIISMLGRSSRSVELQGNLSNAVEEVVYHAVSSGEYTTADTDRFLADVTEGIVDTLDTNSRVQVDVMKADVERGVLTIRVTETFDYLNGKEGSVACERTVIFEKNADADDTAYEVSYYINEDDTIPYKKYSVRTGDALRTPRDPSKTGYTFTGWKDASGNAPAAGEAVTGGKTYYAVWAATP